METGNRRPDEDQRDGDRRAPPDPDYAGPERRQGDRRKDERRKPGA